MSVATPTQLRRRRTASTPTRENCSIVIAKFHYTGPTGPDQSKSADFVGDPGLVGSGRARVVEFSLNRAIHTARQA